MFLFLPAKSRLFVAPLPPRSCLEDYGSCTGRIRKAPADGLRPSPFGIYPPLPSLPPIPGRRHPPPRPGRPFCRGTLVLVALCNSRRTSTSCMVGRPLVVPKNCCRTHLIRSSGAGCNLAWRKFPSSSSDPSSPLPSSPATASRNPRSVFSTSKLPRLENIQILALYVDAPPILGCPINVCCTFHPEGHWKVLIFPSLLIRSGPTTITSFRSSRDQNDPCLGAAAQSKRAISAWPPASKTPLLRAGPCLPGGA